MDAFFNTFHLWPTLNINTQHFLIMLWVSQNFQLVLINTRLYSLWCTESLQWRHNGCDGVSNHQPYDCLLNRLFRRRSKKTSKPRVTGLCAGNSPGTGEFPAQMASYAENVSIWWRHHDCLIFTSTIRCRYKSSSSVEKTIGDHSYQTLWKNMIMISKCRRDS